MPIFESDMPREEMLKRMADWVCEPCGAALSICWGGAYGKAEYMLRCSEDASHEGIVRPHRLGYQQIPGFNLYQPSRRRKAKMEKQLGEERTKALMPYAQAVFKTHDEAMQVLTTIWPLAPQAEKAKAAMICVQYGLNPLMKHLYLIPFTDKKTGEKKWAVVLGIQANRLIAHRAGQFSYLDDTPRRMSEDEEVKIFGQHDDRFISCITKLVDRNGNKAQGYGNWPKADQPYGSDKGNSGFNMACIRSERQVLDRLFAGKLPQGAEVMDAQYMEIEPELRVSLGTGEIQEAAVVGGAGHVEEEPQDSEEALDMPPEAPREAIESKESEDLTVDWVKETLSLLHWKIPTFKSKLQQMGVKAQGDSVETIMAGLLQEERAKVVDDLQALRELKNL